MDYILRTGTIDPSIAVGEHLPQLARLLRRQRAADLDRRKPGRLRIALWSPLAFNLINLVVLRYLFRGLTRNTRLIWLGLWIFFIINWVGQDYFSPQAMAYVLYLACIGLLIRRRSPGRCWPPSWSIVSRGGGEPPDHADDAAASPSRPWWCCGGPAAGICRSSSAALTRGLGTRSPRAATPCPASCEMIGELGKPVANASETLDKAIVSSELTDAGDLGWQRRWSWSRRSWP